MTLFINYQLSIYKDSEATLVAPDPCYKNVNGNPVLIVFTNVAKACDAENTACSVFYKGKPLCHEESYFSKSTGDEPGDLLGQSSRTIQGKAVFRTSSENVYIEGIRAVKLGDLMVSNDGNTPPIPILE